MKSEFEPSVRLEVRSGFMISASLKELRGFIYEVL